METEAEPDWVVAQRLEKEANQASWNGYLSAKIWIVAPALISVPIMWVFGEGGYIVPIMGVLWAGLVIYGWRLRKSSPKRSAPRARGFWIAVWSFILSATCLGCSAIFLIILMRG
jgi:hypothetical protein